MNAQNKNWSNNWRTRSITTTVKIFFASLHDWSVRYDVPRGKIVDAIVSDDDEQIKPRRTNFVNGRNLNKSSSCVITSFSTERYNHSTFWMEPCNLWPDFSEFSAEFNIWPTRTFLPLCWEARRIFATRVHGVTSTCALYSSFHPCSALYKRAVCTRTSDVCKIYRLLQPSSKISHLSNTEFQFSVVQSFLFDIMYYIIERSTRLINNWHPSLFNKSIRRVYCCCVERSGRKLYPNKITGIRKVFSRWLDYLCLRNYRNNWN